MTLKCLYAGTPKPRGILSLSVFLTLTSVIERKRSSVSESTRIRKIPKSHASFSSMSRLVNDRVNAKITRDADCKGDKWILETKDSEKIQKLSKPFYVASFKRKQTKKAE